MCNALRALPSLRLNDSTGSPHRRPSGGQGILNCIGRKACCTCRSPVPARVRGGSFGATVPLRCSLSTSSPFAAAFLSIIRYGERSLAFHLHLVMFAEAAAPAGRRRPVAVHVSSGDATEAAALAGSPPMADHTDHRAAERRAAMSQDTTRALYVRAFTLTQPRIGGDSPGFQPSANRMIPQWPTWGGQKPLRSTSYGMEVCASMLCFPAAWLIILKPPTRPAHWTQRTRTRSRPLDGPRSRRRQRLARARV